MSIGIFATITPESGHVADVDAGLLGMVVASPTEPGNRRYELLRCQDGAPGFWCTKPM
ncbi:MAG TPA: antibiotic biosynthesis monooxygenase [Rhizomicrobium sp.]|nr:antibiotic biosynthesis monooxygenase [Rhizomicrobium sp.]